MSYIVLLVHTVCPKFNQENKKKKKTTTFYGAHNIYYKIVFGYSSLTAREFSEPDLHRIEYNIMIICFTITWNKARNPERPIREKPDLLHVFVGSDVTLMSGPHPAGVRVHYVH